MYDLIKRIFLKKKLWESSALRVEATKKAEAEAKLAADKVANTKVDEEQQSEQRAREAAVAKADEIRAELNKLFIQQAELEKSVQYEWKEKIAEYEKRSYQEEDEILAKLQEQQDIELQQFMEKIKAESELDKEQKDAAVGRGSKVIGGGNKRKAEDGGGGESSNKRQKVDGSNPAAEIGEINEAATSNLKAGDDSQGDNTEEGEVLQSAIKEKELEVCVLLYIPIMDVTSGLYLCCLYT